MEATGEKFWAQFDVSAVVEALLHDCPYDLYWFDKTTGVMRACKTYMSGRGSVYDTAAVRGLMFAFTVANDYRPANYDSNNPSVDPAKTAAANTVRAQAAAIVAKYASASDYEKLVGYAEEICQLVSYNDNAVSNGYSGGYGNPWQAVFVFDGDTDTNVVCEGYAKAFQYLCNLTSFYDNDVACYTVSGVMSGGKGAGNHMWNVVTMGDGKHYIVDITNIDEGTVGQEGGQKFKNI